jgi:RNA polymerase sigma-70 factor (family 1)
MSNPGYEVALMNRFRAGDDEAFEAVYNSYHYTIFGFARYYLQNDVEAEDIASETFVKLWKLRANFESMQNVLAFLRITTRNACLDYMKYRKRQLANRQALFYLLPEEDQKAFAADEIKNEVLKHIHNAIESLPKKSRRVMQLCVAGMKNGEIAKELNVSVQTVMNQKTNALKKIRICVLEKMAFEIMIALKVFSWFM